MRDPEEEVDENGQLQTMKSTSHGVRSILVSPCGWLLGVHWALPARSLELILWNRRLTCSLTIMRSYSLPPQLMHTSHNMTGNGAIPLLVMTWMGPFRRCHFLKLYLPNQPLGGVWRLALLSPCVRECVNKTVASFPRDGIPTQFPLRYSYSSEETWQIRKGGDSLQATCHSMLFGQSFSQMDGPTSSCCCSSSSLSTSPICLSSWQRC